MANRVKEDEKNEKIIRSLLKLPENRRCINCNSLGPQYVCTSFSTFVCTTCGGIHREFTHRVKSVSMAKFTPQEVSALQGGGNLRAREFFLKEWDPQRNSLPDGSNVERLRDFIKHVYVDRRYTGERNVEKPPRTKMAESEDVSSNKRMDTYQGGSRSPPYDDSFERHHSNRSSPGGKSPGYGEDIRQNSNYRRSPAHAEVVNDWRREDRFGNGRKSEGRSSDSGSKLDGGSPDSQRDLDMSSPPVVRPVRDILGENVSPLRVIEPPKTTGGKPPDGSQALKTVSSISIPSPVVNPTAVQVEASFIDFDSVPEPATTASVDKQMSMDAPSSTQMTASSGGNESNDWANFDSVTQMKAYSATSTSVESVLSELSVTAPTAGPAAPVGNFPPFQPSGSQGLSLVSSFGSAAPSSVLPPDGAHSASFGSQAQQLANTGGGLLATTTALAGGQWPTLNPQQPSLFSDNNLQPLSQHVGAPVSTGSLPNKVWNPIAPNAPRQPVEQANISAANMGQAASFGFPTVSSSEAKSGGRRALPEDLFTVNYPYTPSPVPGWYSGSPYVAGFPMHYNMPMAMPNIQPVSRSINPFDVGNEPAPVQASTFPSLASLQGALPKTATPPGLLHTPSLGAPLPHSAVPQMPSHASAVAQSAFLGQEISRGIAPRPQGQLGFSLEQPGFAPVNSNPQLSGLHPAHSTTSNFTSASGNPFG